MQVRNVECQLAEMQIGRYVSGEPLSSEALRQLESHLSRCKACAKVLVDRRRALKAMLTSGLAAVSSELRTDDKENLLINALKEKAKASAEVPRQAVAEASPQTPSARPGWTPASLLGPRAPFFRTYAKPLLYSAALALVLLGMGYVSRGKGGLFGDTAEKASSTEHPSNVSTAMTAPPQQTAKKITQLPAVAPQPNGETRNTAQPVAASTKPKGANPAPKRKPTVVAAAHAERTVSSPTSKSTSGISAAPGRRLRLHRRSGPATHRRFSYVRIRQTHRAHRQWQARPGSAIKVYDESGKPLGG